MADSPRSYLAALLLPEAQQGFLVRTMMIRGPSRLQIGGGPALNRRRRGQSCGKAPPFTEMVF